MKHSIVVLLAVLLSGVFSGSSLAETVYEKPASFVRRAFGGELPPTRVITLSGEIKKRTRAIMRGKYHGSRIRYWTQGKRSVYILEEIGKTKPITTGFIVDGGRIKEMKILIFRESHGWEVSKDFFRKQFVSAQLNPNTQLTKNVRNIAGATLSVRAVTKLARLALYLESQRG